MSKKIRSDCRRDRASFSWCGALSIILAFVCCHHSSAQNPKTGEIEYGTTGYSKTEFGAIINATVNAVTCSKKHCSHFIIDTAVVSSHLPAFNPRTAKRIASIRAMHFPLSKNTKFSLGVFSWDPVGPDSAVIAIAEDLTLYRSGTSIYNVLVNRGAFGLSLFIRTERKDGAWRATVVGYRES